MAHNRKLVLGATALTLGNVNRDYDFEAADIVRNDLEREIIESGYLEGAPFKFVALMLLYGLNYLTQPVYERIGKHDKALPMEIEIDTHDLLDAKLGDVVMIFRRATLMALIHAGRKYKLKIDRLEALLAELPPLPVAL